MANISGNMLIPANNSLPILGEDSLFSYLEKIKRFKMLSEAEETALVTEFQASGDIKAAHQLVMSHLRLAAKIAFSYRRYGLPMADLISEANLGLMQAVKKFDLSKKVRLATYAMWWIKASIHDYILRSWSLVKIGTRAAQKKLFYNLSRIKARLGIYENVELEPTVVKEIAKELVIDEKDVVEMNRRLSGGDKSLNVSLSDDEDGREKIDLLVDTKENIEEKFAAREEAVQRKMILHKALSKLNEREQIVIRERMLTDSPTTLEDLGIRFNISRERIRQIEKRAFEKLSEHVKAEIAA